MELGREGGHSRNRHDRRRKCCLRDSRNASGLSVPLGRQARVRHDGTAIDHVDRGGVGNFRQLTRTKGRGFTSRPCYMLKLWNEGDKNSTLYNYRKESW